MVLDGDGVASFVDGGTGAIMAVGACVQVAASASVLIQMWKAMLSMDASEVEWFLRSVV